MKNKKLLLISAILGSTYLLYLVYSYLMLRTGISYQTAYFGKMNEENMHSMGLVYLFILIFVHTFFVVAGVILNWISLLHNRRLGVIGGFMYIISGIVVYPWLPYVIIEGVLCFLEYMLNRKDNTENGSA